MIKSFSHIALSFLLLIATMGMAVSKHYCGDALIATSFFEEADTCCDSGNCCHNEEDFIQLDEDFSPPAFSQLPGVIGFDLFSTGAGQYFTLFPNELVLRLYSERKPPPPLKIQTILSLKQAYLL